MIEHAIGAWYALSTSVLIRYQYRQRESPPVTKNTLMLTVLLKWSPRSVYPREDPFQSNIRVRCLYSKPSLRCTKCARYSLKP